MGSPKECVIGVTDALVGFHQEENGGY